MKETIFTGAGVALVTPFNDDFSINFDALEKIVEMQIEGGTDAIISCGTTGEAATLTTEEHLSVIKRTVEIVDHRIPVIAGTGSNDTAFAVELTCKAKELGADASLQVTPYYNKTSQKGLIAHFNAIANASKLPTIIYSVPSRTGVNILPETCQELSKNPYINAIKEASDNISQVTKIALLCGDELNIYSGCDDLILPIMACGGKGVISVLSDVAPKAAHDIAASYLAGDVETSRRLQLEWYDLCKALFIDVNPIPVKEAMNMMGMGVGPCRMPLVEMDEDKKTALYNVLKKHALV